MRSLGPLTPPTAFPEARRGLARYPLARRQPGPRYRSAGSFAWQAVLLVAVAGAVIAALTLGVYGYTLRHGAGVEAARIMAAVAVASAGASATVLLPPLRTAGGWLVLAAALGLSLALVQFPWLAERLSREPLRVNDWLLALWGGFLAVAGPVLLARCLRYPGGAHGDSAGGRRPVEVSQRQAGVDAGAPLLTRYAWVSVVAAVATMALKSIAYVLTGSVALLSDAAESLVNLAGAGLAVVILAIAARPADASHPFGHGRAEYFSSGFTGALILIAAAGILWTAGERLMNPHALADLDIGLIIAIAATCVNLAVARLLLRAGRRHHSITLEADGTHLMTDVWTTGAVLVGLGGVALTGWLWLDAVIAILAAVNIVWAGAQLVARSLSGLLGSAIPAGEHREVERILDRYRRRGVQFHDLRTHAAGAQRLITVHVLVPGAMTVQQGHDLVQAIETDLDAALPNLLIVSHLEPLEDPASFAHAIVSTDRNAPATAGAADEGREVRMAGPDEPSARLQDRQANGGV